MFRPGFRVSRKSIFSFCLVIASFGVLFFLVVVRRSHDHSHVSKNLPAQDEVFFSLPWKQPLRVRDATSFDNSPYNTANKRELTTSGTSENKIIFWQAFKELRLKSASYGVFQNCAVKDCEVSPFEKSVSKAHAVVFDASIMQKQTPPLLTSRRVLVLYDMTSFEVHNTAMGEMFSRHWKPVINWVWSYRLGSDIFEPFAYLQKTHASDSLKRLVDDVTRGKSRLAVWINPEVNRKDILETLNKNLHTANGQTGLEDYMKNLKKAVSFDTIDIVSFQAEMNNHATKKKALLSEYYFMLAFEWVNCQDYVSDLFFYAFDHRIPVIPVVRGGVNYTQHFPKGTFINADDFESPKALASYLEKLATNTTAYTQMLLKKSEYVREDGVKHAWCQLCDMLHRLPQETHLLARYEDIHAWTRENGKCTVFNTSDADPLPSSPDDFQ